MAATGLETLGQHPVLHHLHPSLHGLDVHITFLREGSNYNPIGPQFQGLFNLSGHCGHILRSVAEIPRAGADEDVNFKGRIQPADLLKHLPGWGEPVLFQVPAQLNTRRAASYGGVHAFQISAADFQRHFPSCSLMSSRLIADPYAYSPTSMEFRRYRSLPLNRVLRAVARMSFTLSMDSLGTMRWQGIT